MLQFDIGTCLEAGSDPVAWIRANPGRIRSIHCKDWAPGAEKATRFCSVKARRTGKNIFAAAESVGGVEYYLVEQEGSRFSEFDTAKKCLQTFRNAQARLVELKLVSTPRASSELAAYCLGDTVNRNRAATGRPYLNAGTNFQAEAALISPGSTVLPFLLVRLISPSPQNRSPNPPLPRFDLAPVAVESGGRRNKISVGGIISSLPPDCSLLAASKICACFLRRFENSLDSPST